MAGSVVMEMQSLVVEHQRKLVSELAQRLTDQVRAAGLLEATVRIEVPARKATRSLTKARSARRAKRAMKDGSLTKAQKKAFYMCNYFRKKKGQDPLALSAWLETQKNS